jgi:hypothetical protein
LSTSTKNRHVPMINIKSRHCQFNRLLSLKFLHLNSNFMISSLLREILSPFKIWHLQSIKKIDNRKPIEPVRCSANIDQSLPQLQLAVNHSPNSNLFREIPQILSLPNVLLMLLTLLPFSSRRSHFPILTKWPYQEGIIQK